MSISSLPRFELQRLTPIEWVILDRHFGTADPRHTVANLFVVEDDEVEVEWLRDVPLPIRYMTPDGALSDVERVIRTSRATRPVPIPHLPPGDTSRSA